jgi:Ser/Thr protein kinase RdoA (MazF antagonist)
MSVEPDVALRSWSIEGDVRPSADPGNINRTYEVGDPPVAILQWVNPIFRPEVNLDIRAACDQLSGIATPRLLPTRDGALWILDPSGGHWRLTTFLPGRTLHKLENAAQARSAGAYLGRFHGGLRNWNHTFQAPRLGVHDTAKHMRYLAETVASHPAHALHAAAADVAARIAAAWSSWRGTLDLPERIVHGDPKMSNLRFTGNEVTGILDLDTIGWLPYAAEMGDAWRSWCHPAASEDDLDGTRFDVPTFAASLDGWLSTAPPLELAERTAIVPGIERICLELSARFCADALANTYFREDRARWPEVGTHCLARARAQLRLAEDVRAKGEELEAELSRRPG